MDKNDKIIIVNIYQNKADVYCGRGSSLGNPFKMDSEADRDFVCEQFQDYFYKKVVIERNQSMLRQLSQIKNIMDAKGSVKIGCFCAPRRCHCQTIKKYLLESEKQ